MDRTTVHFDSAITSWLNRVLNYTLHVTLIWLGIYF